MMRSAAGNCRVARPERQYQQKIKSAVKPDEKTWQLGEGRARSYPRATLARSTFEKFGGVPFRFPATPPP
jgi:hypothetical protein